MNARIRSALRKATTRRHSLTLRQIDADGVKILSLASLYLASLEQSPKVVAHA
jgi:hypothetical protein